MAERQHKTEKLESDPALQAAPKDRVDLTTADLHRGGVRSAATPPQGVGLDTEAEVLAGRAGDAALAKEIADRAAVPKNRFGRYVLLGSLGQGAFGVVHRAWDTLHERLVAIKVLMSDTERARERFAREIRATARLRHPRIVPLLDSGEFEGRLFIAMELVEGKTLEDLAEQEGGLPVDEAVKLMAGAAEAIAYAHEQGVLHRDIKPQNIMVDRRGEVLVLDFGLARLEDRDQRFTRTGTTLGTPAYMPPEQAAGKEPSELGDIYALGATLYHALVGRPPFLAATVGELLLKVCREDPTPPSRLNRRVFPDLNTICMVCLEKEPTKRYASAAALAEDLQAYRRGAVIRAAPVGPVGRAWRWLRRDPARTALVGVAAAALLGCGLLGYQVTQSRGLRAQNERLTRDLWLLANQQQRPLPEQVAQLEALQRSEPVYPNQVDELLHTATERLRARTALTDALGEADPARRRERLGDFARAFPDSPAAPVVRRLLAQVRAPLAILPKAASDPKQLALEQASAAEVAGNTLEALGAYARAERLGATVDPKLLERLQTRAGVSDELQLWRRLARLAERKQAPLLALEAWDRLQGHGVEGAALERRRVAAQLKRAQARSQNNLDVAQRRGDWGMALFSARDLELAGGRLSKGLFSELFGRAALAAGDFALAARHLARAAKHRDVKRALTQARRGAQAGAVSARGALVHGVPRRLRSSRDRPVSFTLQLEPGVLLLSVRDAAAEGYTIEVHDPEGQRVPGGLLYQYARRGLFGHHGVSIPERSRYTVVFRGRDRRERSYVLTAYAEEDPAHARYDPDGRPSRATTIPIPPNASNLAYSTERPGDFDHAEDADWYSVTPTLPAKLVVEVVLKRRGVVTLSARGGTQTRETKLPAMPYGRRLETRLAAGQRCLVRVANRRTYLRKGRVEYTIKHSLTFNPAPAPTRRRAPRRRIRRDR